MNCLRVSNVLFCTTSRPCPRDRIASPCRRQEPSLIKSTYRVKCYHMIHAISGRGSYLYKSQLKTNACLHVSDILTPKSSRRSCSHRSSGLDPAKNLVAVIDSRLAALRKVQFHVQHHQPSVIRLILSSLARISTKSTK